MQISTYKIQKNLQKILLEPISEFSRNTGYKANNQKPTVFLYSCNKKLECFKF